MKVAETALPDVLLISPQMFRDNRGGFVETWNLERMAAAGLPSQWVQDNFSWSRKNVIRGIHYQVKNAQGKLVRVSHGAALDVAVDLRRRSPNFGRHVAVELSAENGQMLWIPEGFGHGFMALSESVGFSYKVTNYYSPEGERTIAWNDPDLGICWPVEQELAMLSDKDRNGALFRDAEVFP